MPTRPQAQIASPGQPIGKTGYVMRIASGALFQLKFGRDCPTFD